MSIKLKKDGTVYLALLERKVTCLDYENYGLEKIVNQYEVIQWHKTRSPEGNIIYDWCWPDTEVRSKYIRIIKAVEIDKITGSLEDVAR